MTPTTSIHRPHTARVERADHDRAACVCCQRASAIANAHVEHIVMVEHERDEARGDSAVYRELAQSALDVARHATAERDRLTERLRHVLDQLQALRADDRRAA